MNRTTHEPCNVIARLVVSELVWYLTTEVHCVKEAYRSINYIHEAYRNYLSSYQEVPIKNEPTQDKLCNQLY